MNRFRFKACVKCRGDLVLDEGDWLCLQCGTYYYTGLYRKQNPTRWPQQPAAPPRLDKTSGECNRILPGHSEPSEESGEVKSHARWDPLVTTLPRTDIVSVLFEILRLDRLAADSLAEQNVSSHLDQLPALPLSTKLTVSMRHQRAV